MEDIKERIKAYTKDLSKKLSKYWDKIKDFSIEHKNELIGVILVVAVVIAGFYFYRPMETAGNLPSVREEKITIPYFVQNMDLSILIEYEWTDIVYRSEWECMKVSSPPKAKLFYTVKNNGETFDEPIYLPVPNYIYPDQFQTKPGFMWINGLFIEIKDEPLPAGANETYEFTVNLQAYQEICNLENEINGYSKEVENKHQQLITANLPAEKRNQIDEAYISFKSAKEDINSLVEIVRAGDPSITLSSMDKINKFNIRQTAVLSQNIIANEYSSTNTETSISRMEDIVSKMQITELLNEIRSQRQEINELKTQLQKQLDKPNLEDLLRVYYNVTR